MLQGRLRAAKYGFSLLECCCWMLMRRQRSTGRGNCAQLPKTEIVDIRFILLPTGEPESRDLQICHFFWKVHQLWAGQGHQNSYLAMLKNCHNIFLLPSCHSIEVSNSTVNVITFKIKLGLFWTWFWQVDQFDLPTP